MKYYFSYLIVIIFIISNKLFLFNEEFLILICFIAFCVSIYSRLSPLIQLRFDEKIESDNYLIENSLNNIEKSLEQKMSLNLKIKQLKNLFILLRNHYKFFSKKFLLCFVEYLDSMGKNNIINKLSVFKRIQEDYYKFIFLLVTKKINSLNSLVGFFNNILPVGKFKIFNKINKLTLLKKI